MLDVYLRGDVDRISPEAPVPVVRVRERRDALGGAANVAQNVAALGGIPRLVAAVGRDVAGARLHALLDEIGAGTDRLVEVDRPTITKTRILARVQQVVRVDEEEDADLPTTDAQRIAEAVEEALADADARVLEDYNKGVLTSPVITRAIAQARSRRLPVVVDPKYRNLCLPRGDDVQAQSPRTRGGAWRGNGSRASRDPAYCRCASRGRTSLADVRRAGNDADTRGGEVTWVPTTAREVYDVVGAGDTVTAYLAATLAAGASAREAAVTSRPGWRSGSLGRRRWRPSRCSTPLAACGTATRRYERTARDCGRVAMAARTDGG
jgi:bifunctional ADP-heptose synthase (sugar kinase/adenylyltransferase)